MARETKFGVLLPHFGEHCTRELITDTAIKADELGYDSVWVRDHVYIPPEEKEHGGIIEEKLAEPLMTLAAVAEATDSLTLGSAVIIPLRHPLHLSQNLGTLSFLNDGNVICGLGSGTFKGEFDALDISFDKRPKLVSENIEILRRTFNESEVNYNGELYQFEDVTINPRPVDETPIWYGGSTPLALKMTADLADGWLPGPKPFHIFEEKFARLKEFREKYNPGKPLTVGLGPKYAIAKDSQAARNSINTEGLIRDHNAVMDYTVDEDNADGLFIAGEPSECVEQLKRFEDLGVDHFWLDMRHGFEDRLEEMLELTADEVIPEFN